MAEYQLYQQPGQQQQGGPPPPRPPRKNPYHDGISSSTQHYDLFEMIRRPDASKANRPPDPPPRSLRPLSKQKQIELEIEKGFRETRQKQAGPSFMASLIKFFFLVLILPPYIILYRIPKFLFVDWIVALANAIDNALARICKAIQQAYERQKTKIRNAVINFWKLLKAKVASTDVQDDEPLSFLAFIAAGIAGLYRVTLHPLIQISIKSWRLAKRGTQAIREFPMRLHHAIQDTLKRINRLHNRILDEVKKRLYEAKEKVANRTWRPVSRWIDAKVEALIAIYYRLIAKMKKIGEAILFAFRHPIQTSRMAHEAIRDKSKSIYARCAQLVKQWLDAKKSAIHGKWVRLRTWFDQKIASPIIARWNAFKRRVLAEVERITAPFKKAWSALRHHADDLKLKVMRLFEPFLERSRSWSRRLSATFNSIFHTLRQAWLIRYTKIKSRISNRLAKIRTFLLAFAEPFIWAGRELWNVLKPLFDPFLKTIVRLQNGFQSRVDALVYRVRYMIAWIHVLCRYGMELVRGTTDKLWNTGS